MEKLKNKNVLYIDSMKHNLLSVSQMCDKEHNITFNSHGFEIRKEGLGRLVASAHRTSNNVYMLNEIQRAMCNMGQMPIFHMKLILCMKITSK
jgi:hypothetical protein